MIQAKELRDRFRTEPFEPFELQLSTGDSFPIRHPVVESAASTGWPKEVAEEMFALGDSRRLGPIFERIDRHRDCWAQRRFKSRFAWSRMAAAIGRATAPVLVGLTAVVAGTRPALSQPVVPGYSVTVYADVPGCAPWQMSFAPDGTLYIGNDIDLQTASNVRVVPGGGIWEFFGPALADPEGALVDLGGQWSGTPGSVLIACGTLLNEGVVWAIFPDGTASIVLGPESILANASYIRFDSTGNLLVNAWLNGTIVRLTGNVSDYTAEVLVNTGQIGGPFAMDSSDRIYVSTTSTGIPRYSSEGVLEFTIPTSGDRNAVATGPGGPWGDDFYYLDRSNGTLFRVDESQNQSELGVIPGSLFYNMEFGPDLALYVGLHETGSIYRITCLATVVDPPDDQAVCMQGNATFYTAIDSPTRASYQWRKDGFNLTNGPTDTGSIITGATSDLLSITNVSTADTGPYDCVISNACGNVDFSHFVTRTYVDSTALRIKRNSGVPWRVA